MSPSHCHLISALDSLEIGKAAGMETLISPALCSSCPSSPALDISFEQHQREGVRSPRGRDETPGRPGTGTHNYCTGGETGIIISFNDLIITVVPL